MTNQSPVLTDRLDSAFALARTLHLKQYRKSTSIPYLSHLMSVAAIVLEHGGDEDLAIAGLLHDAVEDQGGADSLTRIRAEFGDRVADVVDACSDTDQMPKPPWRERKEAYLRHLATADSDTFLVSAADKLHNSRSILMDLRTQGEDVWTRFSGGKDGSLWYYRALADAYRRSGRIPEALLREIETTVDDICRLAKSRES